MTEHELGYLYQELGTEASFRIAELLPGDDNDPIECRVHPASWSDTSIPEYEAISYVRGDLNQKANIICHGRRLKVTQNLYNALHHFRQRDKSRYLWADAICIDQSHVSERNAQVKQMRKIYENAKTVLIWLGPDTPENDAETAINSIRLISEFLRQKLDISTNGLSTRGNVYHEVAHQNRSPIPLPNEIKAITKDMWKALAWLYSHSYFTRVWVIQEINANQSRLVHCGHSTIEWDQVELVAGYIIMEPAFSKAYGFTDTKCWWAATATTERLRKPKNWLYMLYLASNFASTDPRDMIYGLHGLMSITRGSKLLYPDYDKSTVEVYMDAVAAAFVDMQNTDVLLYAPGTDHPSWVPRWDRAMLFRNPFRFGKTLPWRPSLDSKPTWSINVESRILALRGVLIDSIKGRVKLGLVWRKILENLQWSRPSQVYSRDELTAAATSLSFGLNEDSNPGEERTLMQNFVSYLRIVLDEEAYQRYIPPELSKEAERADGYQFGKPVWDFNYPEVSSIFITEKGLIGCYVSTTNPGNIVTVPFGSTYPFVLRPQGDQLLMRGYGFIHGMMRGEGPQSPDQVFEIR
ncbi:HET-domain containing protein [Fusarium agapanthi]|uniref:HET-domain containing protein n=1 Tax=Fusarium agapanthi TaxID=1803897 RepID=A0A9P5AZL8_9HYPO|nr:HET-domain containing protein [Fusarium agapanthi]